MGEELGELIRELRHEVERLRGLLDKSEGDGVTVHTILYDEVEEYQNCTVQVLRNTVTGDVSVGWWQEEENEQEDEDYDGD